MDSGLGFLIYISVKYLTYTGWCYLGIGVVGGRQPRLVPALGWGLLRLLIGVFFGVGIFLIGGVLHRNAPQHPWLSYFEIYAPVRWIEWSIMAMVLSTAPKSFGGFLLGTDGRSRLWRLGGTAVSHLADIPLILSAGKVTEMLPVGRFLC